MLRIYSILLALVLDLLIGDPYHFPHPVRFIGKWIYFMEKKLRIWFPREKDLKFAGFILTVSTIGLSYFLIWILVFFSREIGSTVAVIVEGILLYTTFSVKCLKDEAMKIYHSLGTQDLAISRKALSYIVGRDTQNLNREEIVRAVVETVSENTVDGFLSPLFYALIGGAPLAMAYKAANTLDSMVGYKNEKYQNLGYCSAKTDDVLNFIPARLSVLFFALSSLLLRYDWLGSVRIAVRDRKNHKSPNCAYPEGAVAGALSIQLGGTNLYFGQQVYKPTIGDKKRSIEREDIVRTCRLMYGATLSAAAVGIWVCYFCIHMRM